VRFIAELLSLLGNPPRAPVLAAMNRQLAAVSRGGIEVINLLPEDYGRIAKLYEREPICPAIHPREFPA
jgi:hypothetical protein